MRKIASIILLIITAALIWMLNTKLGMVPPIGKFLDPFGGFWQNAEPVAGFPYGDASEVPGLEAEVTVYFNERGVPHVFAENDHDLYLMQGYLTARDRLWQMELQTYAAGGRLSEIIGPRTLTIDRLARRRGMRLAAEKTVDFLEKDPQSKGILDAYTAGINAWINEVPVRKLPIEYKFLDLRPEQWTNLKTTLLLKYMANMLTGYSQDFEMTNSLLNFGPEMFAALYPDFPDTAAQSPIIPRSHEWNFDEIVSIDTPQYIGPHTKIPELEYPEINPNNGSNNWAVHGSRTKSGNPILCNDPHLALNLPSIWYEIQLSTPEMNCHGASLPGAPAIIIGFNQNVSWGVTNASRDVQDWYHIEFKDASRKEYRFGEEWLPTEIRVEEIGIRGSKPLMDTVLLTRFGPLTYDENFSDEDAPLNLAVRWTAHEPSNEMLTFHLLNRAGNHQDYRDALKLYACPGQNFIFSSREGDVAITQQGKFPVKWPGQGKFVMEGAEPLNDWQAYIPFDQNPHVLNPPRGFVSSANQLPTDATYPYDVSGRYEYFRNRRINQVLGNAVNVTVEDMQKLQNDNFNMMAAEALPTLLSVLEEGGLNDDQMTLLDDLKSWNYYNDPHLTAPSVFEIWSNLLNERIWVDDMEKDGRFLAWPQRFERIRLLRKDSTGFFADDQRTSNQETLEQLSTETFREAADELFAWQDSLDTGWTWGRYKNTEVLHVMRLPAFSRNATEIGGNYSIVNACSRTHGPSWRMIVEMGEEPRAFGNYPGGQSGNPGSPRYDQQIKDWAEGKYYELPLLKREDANHPSIIATEILKPAS